MSVHIDERLCKGCGLCVHYCPCGSLSMSERRNQKGYTVAELSDLEKCKPCKICEIVCPDLAVYVEKEP